MTESEIIDKVYDDTIEQAVRMLFQSLMLSESYSYVRHEEAERRYKFALTAAETARNRAKSLKGE